MSDVEKATMLRWETETHLLSCVRFHRANLLAAIERAKAPGDGWPESMPEPVRLLLGRGGWTPKRGAFESIPMKVHCLMRQIELLRFYRQNVAV